MITIAVDAMGGDHAPRPEVEGSVLAAREYGVRILLVGQPNVVRAELARHAEPNLPIEVVPASVILYRAVLFPLTPVISVAAPGTAKTTWGFTRLKDPLPPKRT